MAERRWEGQFPRSWRVVCRSEAISNVDVAGTLGTEYNTWINQDRHADAFQVLYNEVSSAIQNRLGVETRAFEDQLCLGCHGHPVPEIVRDSFQGQDSFRPIGVGCENCHGPAGNWLSAHYQHDWNELSAVQKADQGMNSLSTTTQRARLCATCHVGENLNRQVHHDLIAAGHPRLNFEFSSFMARMPRHWDRSKNEPTEAQSWAVGQAVSLQSALRLLQRRAAAALSDEGRRIGWLASETKDQSAFPKPTQPWPEFSEYSCFACHHDLQDAGVRYGNIRSGQQPGSLTWNTWGMPMAQALAKYELQSEWLEHLEIIDELMRWPFPDLKQVAMAAEKADKGLDNWIKDLDDPKQPFSIIDLREFLLTLEPDPEQNAFQNVTAHWDAVAQLYLALRALERAELIDLLRRGHPPGLREWDFHDRLNKMVKYLRFPEGQTSPGPLSESIFHDTDSSEGFVRIAQEALDQVRLPPSEK